MVNRKQLNYNEIMDVLDIRNFPSERTRYTLPVGIYEFSDFNKAFIHLLPDIVKVNNTIDDIRLKTNLNINRTLIFTKKSFLYTILGFDNSQEVPLNNIEGFYQILPGTYKSDKPINITGINKFPLKCDCINGSIVNGSRERILYSFLLSSHPGHKIYKEPRAKLFKKVNRSVLSHITFYLEDDDHKPTDFN